MLSLAGDGFQTSPVSFDVDVYIKSVGAEYYDTPHGLSRYQDAPEELQKSKIIRVRINEKWHGVQVMLLSLRIWSSH